MGTALAVGPFNSTVDKVGDCPKVLINMENTDYSGYDFEYPKRFPERLFLKGKCDDVVLKIATDCGWGEEFSKMIVNCKNSAPDVNALDAHLEALKHEKMEDKQAPMDDLLFLQ